ncbi:hypothetical protein [Acinetobacter sp.]|uniref:hypothetical protein n=1 Tax=Acinetobacter sp. TaxID=472 RepID=UPI00388E447B
MDKIKQQILELLFTDGKFNSRRVKGKNLSFLKNLPGYTVSEKVWLQFNTRPKCYCGKETTYLNFTSGYRQYCSCKCLQNSPFTEFDRRHRQEKLWSNNEWKEQTAAKMKATHFKNRTPAKLAKLAEKGIIPLDEIVPGQANEYRFQHTCGEVFLKSFARPASIYCPKCHVSQGQGELYELIRKNYSGTIIVNHRTAITQKEIDIYLPELKLGFEFNGKYWQPGDGSRKRFKTDGADLLGIKIVHVWEIEWKKDRRTQEELVLSSLQVVANKS